MRKILLFLIVFGAGLAVLFFVDRESDADPSVTPSTPEARPVAPRVERAGDDTKREPTVEVAGAFRFDSFDEATGKRQYSFQANVESLAFSDFDPTFRRRKTAHTY